MLSASYYLARGQICPVIIVDIVGGVIDIKTTALATPLV